MSRPGAEQILVKPQSDVYTALLGVTLVVLLVGLIILFVRAASLFPDRALWAA